jgi:type I restriction enzyme, S subunit
MKEVKKTELGLIPNDWEIKKLIEVSDINPNNLPKETDNKTVIKYVDIESVSTGKIANIRELLFKFAPSRARRVIHKNDIIISTVRPYLKAIAMVDAELENLVCSTGFAVIRAKNNNISEYLYQCVLDDNFLKQLINKMVGSNYPAVTSKDIEQALVLTPPIIEQKKISSILSTVDDLIENTTNLINSYSLLKKGLMQILLTKGIGHIKFKQTEIGEIPEEWEVCNIGKYIKLQGGFAFKSANFTKDGINILRISNINEGCVNFNDCVFYPIELINDLKEYYLEELDTVIAMSGATTGKIGIISKKDIPCLLNQRVGKFKIIDYSKIDKRFIYYLTNTHYFQNKIWDFAIGDAQPNISGIQIECIKVAIPSIQEQKRISEILHTLDLRINLYKDKKEYLNLLKKGLMQQLLTGKIRVKV